MNTLHAAIQHLAADDPDHAANLNGVGFNKFDNQFGHDLAAIPAEQWTPRQTRKVWAILKKYSGQLSAAGIDYDAIPEPPQPTDPNPTSKRITLSKDRKQFIVVFPYNAALVNSVKSLPDRRFDGASKTWKVTANASNIEPLFKFAIDNGFEIVSAVLNLMAEMVEKREATIVASRAEDAAIEIAGLGGELRPFQRAGVAYALNAKRTFIADEMGLGKTVQALATIHAANAYPAIVVCPASLKLNWAREATKWLPGRTVAVWNGKAKLNHPADVVIINYDVLKKNLEALQALKPQTVIFDESHYAKNYKAQRTEAAKALAHGVAYRLALTGTPILNRPQELLSQLGIIGRLDDLGGFWNFVNRYCATRQDRFGLDLSGAEHLDELNEKLRATCYVRRNKSDVLKELPAKQRSILPVALSNAAEYKRAERDLIAWLRDQAESDTMFNASLAGLSEDEQRTRRNEHANSAEQAARRAEQLVKIETLKLLAATGKLEAVTDWVESFIETGEKLVVFAHHIAIVEALAEKFNAPAITGSTPIEKRQEYVDRFQTEPTCKIIVLNIRAGGVGLTLTAASNVAFVELDWTPAAHDQAEDRCHRIGQTNAVNVWYFLAEATIDTQIHELIEKKRAVVDAATNGATEVEVSMMKELIKNLIAK